MDPNKHLEPGSTPQEPERAGGRGSGWYRDPYGELEQQRWYDGRKWTREVRERPTGEEPPGVRILGPPAQGPDFPLTVDAVIGQQLRLLPTDRVRRPWRGGVRAEAAAIHYSYELVAGAGREAGRVGSIELGGVNQLARMASAEGEWSVTKRRPLGWELIVMASDGRIVGTYTGRSWLSGGTLSIGDSAPVLLRSSPSGRWHLQARKETFVDIRPHGPSMVIAVRSQPADVISQAHLLVLTGCAVVLLHRTTISHAVHGG